MKKGVFLLGVFAIVPFIALACAANEMPSASGIDVGEKALDFKLTDLNGKGVSLSGLTGKKAALVTFTTTWCPHCITIIPALKEIYKKYKDREFEILAVYIRESKSTMEEFAKNHQLNYPVLLDSDGGVASAYRIVGVPTVIIIDKEGIIRYKGYGIPEDIIKDTIK